MRHGHIPEQGWHWWWLNGHIVLVEAGRHGLLLVVADAMARFVGPTYAEREISTPVPPEQP